MGRRHRVLVFCASEILQDARVRKSGQWWAEQGDSVIYLEAIHEMPWEKPTAQGASKLCAYSGGMIDGWPLFWVSLREWSERAMRGEDPRAELMAYFQPDVIHAHEFSSLGFLTQHPDGNGGRVFSKPDCALVYDAHEYEAGRLMGPISEMMRQDRIETEIQAAPLCDAVIVVSHAIKEQLKADMDVDAFVVPNAVPAQRRGPDTSLMPSLLPRAGKRVAYCGLIAPGRNLDQLIRVTQDTEWLVVLVGKMTDECVSLLDNDHVYWLKGPRPGGLWPYAYKRGTAEPKHHLDAISGAHVGFNGPHQSVESYRMSLPNKFFEYAMAGVRSVNAPSPDMAKICEQFGIGETYEGDHDLLDKLEICYRKGRLRPEQVGSFSQSYSFEAVCSPVMQEIRNGL